LPGTRGNLNPSPQLCARWPNLLARTLPWNRAMPRHQRYTGRGSPAAASSSRVARSEREQLPSSGRNRRTAVPNRQERMSRLRSCEFPWIARALFMASWSKGCLDLARSAYTDRDHRTTPCHETRSPCAHGSVSSLRTPLGPTFARELNTPAGYHPLVPRPRGRTRAPRLTQTPSRSPSSPS
jgi:hypothetical protein